MRRSVFVVKHSTLMTIIVHEHGRVCVLPVLAKLELFVGHPLAPKSCTTLPDCTSS